MPGIDGCVPDAAEPDGCPAGECAAGLWLRRRSGGLGLARRGGVEPVQVVQPHQGDQVRAVFGVGGVDAGQVVREGVGDRAVRHGARVVAAGGEELRVVGDALGDVVVDAELGVDRDPLAVLELLRRQRDAARGTAALDAEQVVVIRGELAGSPPGLVDGLRDRDRRRHAETLLGRERTRCDLIDERLLRFRARRRGGGRGVLPVRRGRPAGVAASRSRCRTDAARRPPARRPPRRPGCPPWPARWHRPRCSGPACWARQYPLPPRPTRSRPPWNCPSARCRSRPPAPRRRG